MELAFLRTCRTRVWPSTFSELQEPARVHSLEKGTGLSQNSEPAEPGFGLVHSPNSQPAEPRFSTVLSPNSQPSKVWSSEKGTGLSPNSEPVKPGLARSYDITSINKKQTILKDFENASPRLNPLFHKP